MIHLENINKTYHNGAPLHVLKGINLDIERGEFVSIMGASGSGKSTLLNILGILDNYDSGEYYLNDVLIKNLSETRSAEYRNRMIGFIFQSFNLISFKNAVENVALPLFYQGVSRKKRNQMALEYLDKLGLKEWAHHMPNELSGGQKRRVAIAGVLAMEPEVLILDEPTAGLDVEARNEILDLLREYIAQDEKRTILITSHISTDLESLCDDIYLIHDGKIILHEDTDVILEQYGILKVNEEQYRTLDKTAVIKVQKETYGYACFTNDRRFYQENYPQIAVEQGGIDELILMMTGGYR